MKAVNAYFSSYVLRTVIPKNISLTEAEFHRKPSVLIDAKAKGSIAYLNLAKEIISRNGSNRKAPDLYYTFQEEH